ncbi:MAG: diguanylate cyclase [Fibrobacter sp.]|nr:diguanylate cyclase [Fibrobacter sp.]
MKNPKFTRFSRSIVFKSLLLLVVSMIVIVSIGTFIFTQRLTTTALDYNFNTNKFQLEQLYSSINNEIEQFGSRLSLLGKTSEIKSLDAIVAASYLKSYSISSLFASGETVSLYDRHDSLICDNSLLGASQMSYPIEFAKISPHRPYITPWYREANNTPQKVFAIKVSDPTLGDGTLVASFTIRRIWRYLSEFKVGQKGFAVVVNAAGEILYHPDLQKWMNGVHKVSELGLENFDGKTYESKVAHFQQLSNEESYLINYMYNSAYDIGLLSLQPKTEIDSFTAYIRFIGILLFSCAIFAVLLVSLWLLLKLGRPMNHLIAHISQITDGNLDVEEFDVGNRKDEIGQLSKAFNQMHGTIKRQITELNAHRQLLEEEVRERTKELEEANKKLDRISRTDDLTGLPNRRDMNETIEHEMGRSARTHKPFCFIFIDVDHFKQVNDTYGHYCGDLVLKTVAQTLRNQLRRYDVLARFGGEEFLALIPESNLEGALAVAERFRKQVESVSIPYGELLLKATITLGVSQYDPKLGGDRSIQMADRALYEGKESGRNKVIAWDPARTTEEDYKLAAIEMAEAAKIKKAQKRPAN